MRPRLTKDKKCNGAAVSALGPWTPERRNAPGAPGPAAANLADAHVTVVPGRLDTGQGPPFAVSGP
jgi:hypothetical protein